MKAKSFLLWYNERVNAEGIHLLLTKRAQRRFNHFKTEQLIIGVYDIVQYFILELSEFCLYCDGKR